MPDAKAYGSMHIVAPHPPVTRTEVTAHVVVGNRTRTICGKDTYEMYDAKMPLPPCKQCESLLRHLYEKFTGKKIQ